LREPSRRPTLIPDLLELQPFDEKTGDAKRHSALDIDARPGRYTSQWVTFSGAESNNLL
jgi:hypothetical protein